MPTGFPDYGVPSATLYPLRDMGELAARLGSIVTFDRRGDVVWLDDFEAAALGRWITSGSGTGNAVAVSSTRCRNGNQSMALTAGSTASVSAHATHGQAYPKASRFGVELSFNANATTTTELHVRIAWHTGTVKRETYLKYNKATGEVTLTQSDGSDLVVHTHPNLWSATTFSTLKLVIDFDTMEYVRLIMDGVEVALSGNLPSEVSTIGQQLVIQVYHYGTSGSNPVLYVDDVIITQNEP